jgi:PhnB protein
MEFYSSVFGGTLDLRPYGQYGPPDPATADKIMHGQLETANGFTLMAADSPPGQSPNVGDNVSVCLSGEDGDELHGYWDKLSDGATVTVPLEKQMWGDEFGMCTDKFGIHWMVNIGQPQ